MNVLHAIRQIFVCLFLTVFLAATLSARERLYVFYPSILHQQSMQDKLTNALKNAAVTAFGRYDDFMAKVRSEPPDAIITKSVLIHEQLGDYEVQLNGERHGTTGERYVFLSARNPFDSASITSESFIGVVDILGRTGMKYFLRQFFPVGPKPQRVPRVGDLLPVVSLDVAAGILVEDAFVDYFKSTSQLRLSVTQLTGAQSGIVAFAVKKGGNAPSTLAALKKNDTVIGDLFSIERWK